MDGSSPAKRQALGRGLDALLPKGLRQTALIELELDEIRPNPLQPRVRFESERLDELAASLRNDGLLQPIVVRKADEGYEIIAGERRWRAAQRAQLGRVPALVQDVSDERMLELALVENIQRDELSPVEEAHAYQLLQSEFGLTQSQIAERVSRSRTAVTNTLRLLQLPKAIQSMVIEGALSMGHARALLPLPKTQQIRLAQQIAKEGCSVRWTERRVRRLLRSDPPQAKPTADPNVRFAEERLEQRWKTRVQIRSRNSGQGRIIFHFHSTDELDRLFEELIVEPRFT